MLRRSNLDNENTAQNYRKLRVWSHLPKKCQMEKPHFLCSKLTLSLHENCLNEKFLLVRVFHNRTENGDLHSKSAPSVRI